MAARKAAGGPQSHVRAEARGLLKAAKQNHEYRATRRLTKAIQTPKPPRKPR